MPNLRTGRWRRVMIVGVAAAAVAASMTGPAAAGDVIWVSTQIPGAGESSQVLLGSTPDAQGDIVGYDPGTGYVFELSPNGDGTGYDHHNLFNPGASLTAVAVDSAGSVYTLYTQSTITSLDRWDPGTTGDFSTTNVDLDYVGSPYDGLTVLPDGDVVTYRVNDSLRRYVHNERYDAYSSQSVALPDEIDPTEVYDASLAANADGDLFASLSTTSLGGNHSYLVGFPASSSAASSVLHRESTEPDVYESFGALTVDPSGTLFAAVVRNDAWTIRRYTPAGDASTIRDLAETGENLVGSLAAGGTDSLVFTSDVGTQTLKATRKPSEPTSLRVEATAGGGARISWEAPTDAGAPAITGVSGYRVYRATGAGAQTQTTLLCDADQIHEIQSETAYTRYYCDLTGLTAGTTYRLWVRAVNDAGYSKPATVKYTPLSPVVFTTDLPRISGPTPDGAVTMTVAVSGDPSPRLVWQRSLDGGDTWKNVKTEKNATTVVRTYSAKLEGAKFRVVAYQKGQPAVISTVTTVLD